MMQLFRDDGGGDAYNCDGNNDEADFDEVAASADAKAAKRELSRRMIFPRRLLAHGHSALIGRLISRHGQIPKLGLAPFL